MNRVCALAILALLPRAEAQNWPQWRGPDSQGVSVETGLPTKWSAHENLSWKIPLAGAGTSSPIIWGDRIFVTSQIGQAKVARGAHPQLARDDESLANRENAIGGSRVGPSQSVCLPKDACQPFTFNAI